MGNTYFWTKKGPCLKEDQKAAGAQRGLRASMSAALRATTRSGRWLLLQCPRWTMGGRCSTSLQSDGNFVTLDRSPTEESSKMWRARNVGPIYWRRAMITRKSTFVPLVMIGRIPAIILGCGDGRYGAGHDDPAGAPFCRFGPAGKSWRMMRSS